MNDIDHYRNGYELGWEGGYANAISRKDRIAWRKLFFLCLAAAFVGCLAAILAGYYITSFIAAQV